eukprot:Gb_29241 [translate_table: standard]
MHRDLIHDPILETNPKLQLRPRIINQDQCGNHEKKSCVDLDDSLGRSFEALSFGCGTCHAYQEGGSIHNFGYFGQSSEQFYLRDFVFGGFKIFRRFPTVFWWTLTVQAFHSSLFFLNPFGYFTESGHLGVGNGSNSF